MKLKERALKFLRIRSVEDIQSEFGVKKIADIQSIVRFINVNCTAYEHSIYAEFRQMNYPESAVNDVERWFLAVRRAVRNMVWSPLLKKEEVDLRDVTPYFFTIDELGVDFRSLPADIKFYLKSWENMVNFISKELFLWRREKATFKNLVKNGLFGPHEQPYFLTA